MACLLLLTGSNITLTPYPFPELRFFPTMPIPDYNPVTVEGADLGRHLFYDPVLSKDSTMSCASCHKQQAAFSDSPKAFSMGRNNIMIRNTLPLFNLAWYPALFWDGRAADIEAQVFHPVRDYNEMNLDWKTAAARLQKNEFYRKQFKNVFGTSRIDSIMVSYAIGQFLRTLISYQSKYDKVLSGNEFFSKDEYAGFNLVNDQTKGNCLHCHSTDGHALGTLLMFSNNGLDAVADADDFKDKGRGGVTGKKTDNGKFKVPSLRNLAFTAPYMHDGRFKTLEEVIDFYSEGVKPSPNLDPKMEYYPHADSKLNADEKKQVIAFLLTLSDSVFVAKQEFSNPFSSKAE